MGMGAPAQTSPFLRLCLPGVPFRSVFSAARLALRLISVGLSEPVGRRGHPFPRAQVPAAQRPGQGRARGEDEMFVRGGCA